MKDRQKQVLLVEIKSSDKDGGERLEAGLQGKCAVDSVC